MRAPAIVLILAVAALAQTPDEKLLAKHAMQPTRASIARFLRYMFPGPKLRARIDYLVERLDDRDAAIRDAAMRELIGLHSAPLVALKRAATSRNPEVRKITRELIVRAEAELNPRLLFVVFRTIRREKMTGLTPEILNAIPLASDFYVRKEAERALLETARPDDLEHLLAAARDPAPDTRVVALRALRQLDTDAAKGALLPALQDRSSVVRAAAARELAELRDRRSLAALVELLSAAEEPVRFRAAWTLRAISGKSFKFAANADPAKRAVAVAAWQKWLATEGKTVEWITPIRSSSVLLGRTLIALYSKNKVIELDGGGSVIWEQPNLPNPWAVHGLPNGHRLISLYSQHKIVEFDASGTKIWESKKMPGLVSSLCGLQNGNILAAMGYSDNRIIEVSREKNEIVWQLKVPGRPVCAVELPGGNLLVTLNQSNEVVEIDRQGRRTWGVRGLKQPYSASRLANGNTLVADYGNRRIVEFDLDGRQVWEFKGKASQGMQWVYTAARLADGSTLYGDNGGLNRIDAAGQQTWKFSAKNAYLYFHRY
ncbi:MAG: HEAT repeat domain-containing protein [Planctomycetota bacterium]|jgi:HEAT repeat protein